MKRYEVRQISQNWYGIYDTVKREFVIETPLSSMLQEATPPATQVNLAPKAVQKNTTQNYPHIQHRPPATALLHLRHLPHRQL